MLGLPGVGPESEPFDMALWWAKGCVAADIEEKYTLVLRNNLLLGTIPFVRTNICVYRLVPIGRLLTSWYLYSVFLHLLIVQCLLFLLQIREQRSYFFSHLVKHSKYYLTQLIWNQEADTQPNQLLFIQVTCLGPNCLGFFASVFIPLGLALECYCPYHSLFRVGLDFSLVFFLHIPFLFPQLFLPPFPPCICISSLIYFPENIHSAALLIMAGWWVEPCLVQIISTNFFFDSLWRFQRMGWQY